MKTPLLLLATALTLLGRSVTITVPASSVDTLPDDLAMGICPENREIREKGYHVMNRNSDGSYSTQIPHSYGKINFYLNSYQHAQSYHEGAVDDTTARVWSVDLATADTVTIKPQRWFSAAPTENNSVGIVFDSLISPSDSTSILLSIYLPPNYSESNKAYPVVYVHDGNYVFHFPTCYCKSWDLNGIMDSLSEAGEEVPIIVGIDNPTRRWRLTPWSDGGGTEFNTGGGVEHAEFIVNSVKPHIDSLFRTLPDRENTTIAGASRGGMFALYMGFTYPELFGSIYAFSPALYYSDELYPIIEKQSVHYQPKVVVFTGNQESNLWFKRYARKLFRFFDRIDYPEENTLFGFGDGKHDGKFWNPCFLKAHQFNNNGKDMAIR